ncbi:exodeoxyribonuclease V subunit gamma [Sodalis-like secondary symbiont of Drepanosiphum platanoidis]|uniref:exodeoxyribonuclease V subunit gamma n=1 Tax=Sodalis-like secondary symbiont of Drepanosiphum platanoidis TaxID=2994493 RepID=UPI0034644017
MFIVYHSNRLDLLKSLVSNIIKKQPLKDIFESEIILTQSKGMSQWMQIELCKDLGISSNIKFVLPANFIWNIFMKILPDILVEDSFTKISMTWRFMSILPSLYKKKNFIKIKSYLKNFDIQKMFYFASGIADLFDQYLVFRPEWINSWQNKKNYEGLGEDQYWQSSLWRYFIKNLKKFKSSLWNRSNIYNKCIKILSKSFILPKNFPKRIFIFGISSLPLTYLKVLYFLSRHIDIHFLFKNPCKHYWENIQDNKTILNQLFNNKNNMIKKYKKYYKKKSIKFINQKKLENPLLSSWGKLGKDTISILSNIQDIQEIKLFIKNKNKSLLNEIQKDIFNLEDNSFFNMNVNLKKQNKRKIYIKDNSISINVCHSIQREVEILQDELLTIFQKDSSLEPKDIVVMVANIKEYSPSIKSVFGDKLLNRNIPFSISEFKSYYMNNIIKEFFNIIKLFHSRFTSQDVLNLLKEKSIKKKFCINSKEIKIIYKWIKQSGIRWGLDKKTINFFNFPIKNQYTWKYGLKRMLLGYAMDDDDGTWNKITPYDEINGKISYIINKIYEIINLLCYWRDKTLKNKPLNLWKTYIEDIINDFFILDEKSEHIFLSLKKYWNKIIESGLNARYKKNIPISILENELFNYFNNKKINQSFIMGKINFCTLMPLRSIPFKMICILGMNEKDYPRSLIPLEFDLISKNPRIGDRNRRNDDCYLFLEAILSAKKYLYISFIGNSIKDNTLCNPSFLITELNQYINQSFYIEGDNQNDINITKSLIKSHIWKFHNRFIFSSKNFLLNDNYQTFCSEWLKLLNNRNNYNINFVKNLKIINTKFIFINDIKNFYINSVRFWFKKRLGINFNQKNKILKIEEPFIINKFMHNKIRNEILNVFLYKKNINNLYNVLNSSGKLPYGIYGNIYWNNQLKEITFLSKKIKKFLKKKFTLEIKLKINKIKLKGFLFNVQKNGIIKWKTNILSIKDGFLLWLEHLIYCSMGNIGESHIFGIKNHWYCPNISVEDSKKYLNYLIKGYFNGLKKPIILVNSSSIKIINYFSKLKKENINENKIINDEINYILYNEMQYYFSEDKIKKNFYLKYITNYIKKNNKNVILDPIRNYLFFPFINNLIKINNNFY